MQTTQKPGTRVKSAEAKPKSLASRLLPLGVLAAIGTLVISQGWHSYLTLEQLAANREALGSLIEANLPLALISFIGIYIVVVALSLPGGALLTATSGFLFGWLAGGSVSVIGATIGAAVIFLIAKTSLGEPLAARADPLIAKLREGFQENALSYLLFLRLVPVFPFWLVNLAPALLGVRFTTYLIGTGLGIIPGTFAFAFAGVGLDSLIEAQRRAYETCLAETGTQGATTCQFFLDQSALVPGELLIAFALLGAVALIPAAMNYFKGCAG